MKTIDTKHLRDFIQRASPTPWLLATSNSWRRIVDANHAEVCAPCTQPDGHPDLRFVGGYEGANAQLLIEAVNSLPVVLDTLDAQAAEIARLREALKKARLAIGDHHAPEDCYATGPLTGNPIKDLVECPACAFIDALGALQGTSHDR